MTRVKARRRMGILVEEVVVGEVRLLMWKDMGELWNVNVNKKADRVELLNVTSEEEQEERKYLA
jgi:hypothetical protein